jgi:steroid 5-alpha reductase family enzyme
MSLIAMGEVLGVTACIVMALVLLLWLLSIPLRDISIIDMAFAGLIAIALLAAYRLADAQGLIPGLIVVLVLVWACRMSIYLVRRNWGHGEDPRYTRLRQWVRPGWPFHWLSLRQVFLLQGAVIWTLTLPQQIAMVTGSSAGFGLLAGAGLGLWCLGFFFETVGDYQLSRFRADPMRRGQVLDTGLWRYTRHPNYFGELCQWWGLFLIAAEAPWAWCGIVGPLVYSWLVINVTGQRTLDKKLAREKPEYAHYMRTTNGLIPGPPRRE